MDSPSITKPSSIFDFERSTKEINLRFRSSNQNNFDWGEEWKVRRGIGLKDWMDNATATKRQCRLAGESEWIRASCQKHGLPSHERHDTDLVALDGRQVVPLWLSPMFCAWHGQKSCQAFRLLISVLFPTLASFDTDQYSTMTSSSQFDRPLHIGMIGAGKYWKWHLIHN